MGAIWDKKGGMIGSAISSPLLKLFDFYTSVIVLTALLVISLLIIFETRLNTDSFRALTRMLGRKNDNDNEEEIEPMIADSTDQTENKGIEKR